MNELIESNLVKAENLANQGKLDDADSIFKAVLEMDPNSLRALQARRLISFSQEKYEESIEITLKIIEIDGPTVIRYKHLGNCYMYLKQFEKAIQSFETIMTADPQLLSYHFWIAWCYFSLGEWDKAWPHYEYRREAEYGAKHFDIKEENRWNGIDSLEGKKIVVYCEHGLGDYIHLVRFVPELKELGADVYLDCSEGLYPLLEKFGKPKDSSQYDYYCSVASLPYFLKIPVFKFKDTIPYLSVDKFDLSKYKDNFKIGFTWTGNSDAVNWNSTRSCQLGDFKKISEMKNVKLFSLQKDMPVERIDAIDMSEYMTDFKETAKIIQAMDLIITVDTCILHIAGALNKETWALISYMSNCQWTFKGDNTVWYNSVTLFRQEESGNWQTPFSKIEAKLYGKIN